ncbi:ParB/RepB/Spo0J family partition protein [Asticcacaulis machinosus]|uniref:ParB N-terminal domain-containing protein n=1 Tax=Asticcacaulis machinosus TaxID=2984211 RepID=A0ABT5HG53_9CAUL|nr:ParB N-terminal domain-containing protein [Asticcacaulis machinosus]MDC7675168.1 ParB N-terminal domain-containing protein [Asticcacaulis machinosus]
MSKLVLKPVSTDLVQSGFQTLIPLDRLTKSPDNARKTPHSAASLAGLRASIAAKGILQNLIVKAEVDEAGAETGFYFVTAGEGRRLAQIARAKDGEIPRDTPMPCVIRETDDAHEVSLDENVTREAMTPADQYEAFRALNIDRGMDAAEIAARFGVSDQTVKQRLRLGAVSPVLMQAYRDEKLTLSQLMAYAVTEDHARQEAAFDRLKGVYNEPYHIKRLLTEGQVPHTDRRARLIGIDAYETAGGVIERDLFTEDGGGYFTDAALLDQLVMQHLAQVAATTRQAEGWKWAEVALDYPYSNGWGRVYKEPQDLSADDRAALSLAHETLEDLVAPFEGADELPDDIDRRAGELEAEIERLEALQEAYLPDDIARGGVFVSLAHDGTVNITRGLIRPEDEVPEPEDEAADAPETDGFTRDSTEANPDPDAEEDGEADVAEDVPLSDLLLRDLTTHRTLALRYALAEQPELAARFLVHKLALDTFYRQRSVTCLDITARSGPISSFADGLDETPTAAALNTRHDAWAEGLPDFPGDLWAHILTLDAETLGALMAHCTASTVFAVIQPYMPKAAYAASIDMAAHLGLDMTGHWRPTVRSYFSRVTKGQILAAVRQAVGDDAADRLTKLKKPEMAAAAEQLVAATGWLPMCLRTPVLPDQDKPDEPDEALALPAPEETDGLPDLPEAAE